MIRTWSNFQRTTLGKILTLALGSGAGQAIVIASSPILTRLYTPEELGRFGAFTALTTLFSSFVCMRLEQTILIVEDVDIASAVSASFASAVACISLYMMFLFFVACWPGQTFLRFDIATVLIAPFYLGLYALYVINQHLCIRLGRFRTLSHYQVLRSFLGAIAQIALSVTPFRGIGLAAGQTSGMLGASFILVSRNIQYFDFRPGNNFIGSLVRHFSKYRSFPLMGAPQSLLNAATASLPILLLGLIFEKPEVGLFWLAIRVLGLPNQVLVESVRAGIANRISELVRFEQRTSLFIAKSSVALGAILAPVSAALFLIGPFTFGLIFGSEWKPAANMAAILSVGWIVQNAAVPSFCLLQITQRQGTVLAMEILGTFARIAALSAGFTIHNINEVLWFYVAANVFQSAIVIGLASGAKAGFSTKEKQE